MEKLTISISQQLVKIFLLGQLIGILVVFITHFFGSWSCNIKDKDSSFENGHYYSGGQEVEYYSHTCPFNEIHRFEGKDIKIYQILNENFNSIKFNAIISGTFDGHWKNIFIIGFVVSTIIYILGKVNFKVVK